jgi:hypothetical protein
MYKYIALSVRTCARIPHNPCASPHSPSSHHVFTGLPFQDQVRNCLEKANSKFSATGATKNLISGGYSSKCNAVCVFIRQVYQKLVVWTVLAWTFMGVKRGRGICVEILGPQTETY